MKRQTSFVLTLFLALLSSVASGSVPADAPPLRVGSAVSDFERIIMRIDDEQHALESELATIDPRLEIVRKRIEARGRAD